METHTPVLVDEVLKTLAVEQGQCVLEATVGTGGHTREIIKKLQRGTYIGIDADGEALKETKRTLSPLPDEIEAHLIEDNFRNSEQIVKDLGVYTCDRFFADLGWGTHQLKGKGFSFMHDEPLTMCYSTKKDACAVTATEVVNTFEEEALRNYIQKHGEERWARRIARQLVRVRKEQPIVTTGQLAAVVSDAIPGRFHPKRIHPATKTFQAIRIVVNDELGALEEFLTAAKKLATKDARIAIISFHSLEDRLVKQTFRSWEEEKVGERYTKRPIRPSEEECRRNPRARSAKLRTFTVT